MTSLQEVCRQVNSNGFWEPSLKDRLAAIAEMEARHEADH